MEYKRDNDNGYANWVWLVTLVQRNKRTDSVKVILWSHDWNKTRKMMTTTVYKYYYCGKNRYNLVNFIVAPIVLNKYESSDFYIQWEPFHYCISEMFSQHVVTVRQFSFIFFFGFGQKKRSIDLPFQANQASFSLFITICWTLINFFTVFILTNTIGNYETNSFVRPKLK